MYMINLWGLLTTLGTPPSHLGQLLACHRPVHRSYAQNVSFRHTEFNVGGVHSRALAAKGLPWGLDWQIGDSNA